jgi:large repetitive protein
MRLAGWMVTCLCLVAMTAACDDNGSGSSPSPLQMATLSLPDAEINASYAGILQATGGTGGPFTFSILSGALPPGLALNGDTIEGTPTAGGDFPVTIEVTDADMNSDQRMYFIHVQSAAPLSITTTTLPDGDYNTPYNAVIDAQDGALAGYHWTMPAGNLPPGLTFTGGSPTASQAEITGTPTAWGSFSITVRVQDALGESSARVLQFDIAPGPLGITSTVLPDGAQSQHYSASVTAAGGTETGYTWSVTAGSLPSGISLTDGTPSALLSGTPSQSGLFTFTLQVQDSNMGADSVQFDLYVAAPGAMAITTTSLADADIGVEYDEILEVTGGTAPYTWSLDSGSLPIGMYIYMDRVVGIPGGPLVGISNFVVQVQDSLGATALQSLSITTRDAGLQIKMPETLRHAVVGDEYLELFQAVGGTPPYSNWQLVGTGLPPGMTFGPATWDNTTVNGVLRGTPTMDGVFNFTIGVHDSSLTAIQRSFQLTVYSGLGDLAIRTAPERRLALSFDANVPLEAAGGSNAGYTWQVPWGELPPGVSLSTSGAPVLTGTPTSTGVYRFVLQVTDSASNTAQRLFTYTVSGAPTIYGQPIRESVVFMTSASGSMYGSQIATVRANIVGALASLPDGVEIDIVAFGSQFPQSHHFGRWFSGSPGSLIEINPLTRAFAIGWVNGSWTNPGGMNTMYHPMEAQTQNSPSSLRQIVLVSADQPNWPQGYSSAQLLTDIQGWWAHFTDCQLVAVSLGTTSTDNLMQQMAALVGGVSVT